jgi:hypothetical protein
VADEPSPESPESPSESPGDAAASSAASSKAPSAFVEDPGPVFDEEAAAKWAAEQPEPVAPGLEERGELHALPTPLLEWERDRVEQLLRAQGAAAHALFGVGAQDWAYTQEDLEAIAPPLTNILNRYDATRAAAAAGDELALAIAFGGYASRSYFERLAILRAQAAQPDEPITGQPAEPGTGPEGPTEIRRMGPTTGAPGE